MADILKITTPLINKNQEVTPKPAIEPTSPFQLHDLSKVLKPHNQRDIMPQNTLLNEADSPEILLDLLKDPGVTVTYLKNIFMLEEIFKLLPQNNLTLTKEIENLYHDLLLPHHEIAGELILQEQESTVFRGEFFDFLRQIVNGNQSRSDMQYSVVNLMRSINNLMIKDDVMDAVANSLSFLAKNLQPNRNLAQKLEILVFRFRQEAAAGEFDALKSEALAVLKEVEESVLFDPKLQKMASITMYNLSRYNDNMAFFHEAAGSLWQKLAGEERILFARYVNSLMRFFEEHSAGRKEATGEEALSPKEAGAMVQDDRRVGAAPSPDAQSPAATEEAAAREAGAGREASPEAQASAAAGTQTGAAQAGAGAGASQAPNLAIPAQASVMAAAEDAAALAVKKSSSKVMDALIELIRKQSLAEEEGKGEAGQVDKILHSLLSSPCNFTPLLHFVAPAYLDDVKAFAEIWVNPYDDENGAQGVEAGRRIHILMVVDVDMLGRFEAELKIWDRVIDLSLHCPAGLEGRFGDVLAELPLRIRRLDTPYRMGRLEVTTLEHQRSLMEVFKTLPYKRMGVDIRV
ncbi:MAG: hypothetical protein FWH28_05965 [Clostridiales bacterium]|nr:hypothetical protein [Clostridiales bacterium]